MKERIQLIAALMVCAGLCSCAPTRFVAPSVEPTRAAVTSAQGHTTSAQGHTTKAQSHVKVATEHAGKAKTKIEQLERNLVKQPENLKLAQEVHGELDALTQALIDGANELTQTQADLKQTQADLGTAQTKLTDLDKKNKELVLKANKAIADADRERVKYHRLKFGACALGAGLVAAVIFHFGKFLAFMGPWAWAVMLGGPAVVFGALWFIL